MSEDRTLRAIERAYVARATDRIRELVRLLEVFDDDPSSLSQADRDDLEQWATRAYLATRRRGVYAPLEARARTAARRAIPDPTQKHLADVVLRAYHASLDHVPLPRTSRPGELLDRADRVVGSSETYTVAYDDPPPPAPLPERTPHWERPALAPTAEPVVCRDCGAVLSSRVLCEPHTPGCPQAGASHA